MSIWNSAISLVNYREYPKSFGLKLSVLLGNVEIQK